VHGKAVASQLLHGEAPLHLIFLAWQQSQACLIFGGFFVVVEVLEAIAIVNNDTVRVRGEASQQHLSFIQKADRSPQLAGGLVRSVELKIWGMSQFFRVKCRQLPLKSNRNLSQGALKSET
jgi:hypothetical protein